jgi:hypothetical protein
MYELKYDITTGQVSVIIRKSDGKPIFINETNPDFLEFLKWNEAQAVPLDYVSVNTTIVNAWLAKQEARQQAIIDNLPSWSVVGGKFDAMLADANAATNLAQAKAVLIKLITFLKKSHRVLYWEVKNTEE